MRRICLLVVGALLLATPAIRAGGKQADAPSVVVRVSSINALLKNLTLVVKLVGQEDAAQQIEGLIKSKIGKQGLEGVDPARPIGAYVRFGKAIDEINGALLIPISDEKTFLTLLDNLGVNYAKDKDGIYTYKTNKNVDVYFRFANRYLYVTSLKTESIQTKNLLDPTAALAVKTNAAIAVVARVDQIPNDAKLVALAQLSEAILAAEKKGTPGETKIQEAFRVALLRDVQKFASGVIREGAEIRFDLDVNEKTKELAVNFAVTAKPGSDLARSFQTIGDLKSPLPGILKKDLAFQGAFHLALPEDLNQAFGKVIDEVTQKSLIGIQDPRKKKQAETLFKAMLPTAKSGDFQVVAAILGPKDDRYTFLSALKLKDGAQLGQTVHDLIKEALNDIPPAERSKIQLNFDSAGAVKIHKFQLPKEATANGVLEQLAGDNHLYLAFRDDAVFVALGKDALASMKSGLAQTAGIASTPLVFDFDVARMAKVMAKTQEQRDFAAKLFPVGETGRVRFTVSGGQSLTARLQMQLNVLEYLVK